MKKWIVVVAILICIVLYTMVKFSMSQDKEMRIQTEKTQITEKTNPPQNNENAEKATSEENSESLPTKDSESVVPADKVEAIVKAYNEFANALKNKDYEKAWEYTSKYFKQRESKGNFENFRDEMIAKESIFAQAIIHPDTAIKQGDLIGFKYTGPSFPGDLYLFFTYEDNQWKLYIGRHADNINTLK